MNIALTIFNTFKKISVQAAALMVGIYFSQQALDAKQDNEIQSVGKTLIEYKETQKEAQDKRDRESEIFRTVLLDEIKEIKRDSINVGGDLREIKGMLKNRGYGAR